MTLATELIDPNDEIHAADLRQNDSRSADQRGSSSPTQSAGIGYLRVVGLALVIWQHSCSLQHCDQLTSIGPLNLGQLGVGLFMAVSGFLAGSTSRSPGNWFKARLCRIFPAYWIAIAASLIAAAFVGYKPVSWDLVAAQLLGIGWFTHGGAIVNVPTWFISLLLACYCLAAVLLQVAGGRWLALGAGAALALVAMYGVNSLVVTHVATFLFGFGIGKWSMGETRALVIAALAPLGGALLLLGQGDLWALHHLVAIGALGLSLTLSRIDPVSRWFAELSYYIYLVHGPILVGVASAFPQSWMASFAIGVPTSILTAIVLRRTEMFVALQFEMRGARGVGPVNVSS